MKFIDWFYCWMYGHEPSGDVSGFVLDDELELTVSICGRCGATLVYDENYGNWIKW